MDLFPNFQQITDLPNTFRRNDLTYIQLMLSFAAALTVGTESNVGLLNQANFSASGFAATVAGWNDVWGALPGLGRRFQESDNSYHARIPNMILAARDSPVAIEIWLKLIEGVVGQVVQQLPSWGYTVDLPATLTIPQVQQIVNDLVYVRPAGMPFSVQVSTGGLYLGTVNYLGPVQPQTNLIGTGGVGDILAQDNTQTAQLRSGWDFGGRVTGSFLASGASGRTYLGTVNYFGQSNYIATRFVTGTPTPIAVYQLEPWNFGGRVTGAWFASRISNNAISIGPATNNQLSNLPDILLTDPTINPPT